jgi:hypothetical protein
LRFSEDWLSRGSVADDLVGKFICADKVSDQKRATKLEMSKAGDTSQSTLANWTDLKVVLPERL